MTCENCGQGSYVPVLVCDRCDDHKDQPRTWRCFHCDTVFTSELDARIHFGADGPACMRSEPVLLGHLKRCEHNLSVSQSECELLKDELANLDKTARELLDEARRQIAQLAAGRAGASPPSPEANDLIDKAAEIVNWAMQLAHEKGWNAKAHSCDNWFAGLDEYHIRQAAGASPQPAITSTEAFSPDQILHSLKAFLDWGEQAFITGQQRGYFSGGGFAARAVRFHVEQLRAEGEASVKKVDDGWEPCDTCGGCGEVEKGRDARPQPETEKMIGSYNHMRQCEAIESLLNSGQRDYEQFHEDVSFILGYGTKEERTAVAQKVHEFGGPDVDRSTFPSKHAPDFWRCRECGCFWRDNRDDTVSLASVNEKSCSLCEFNPTATACEPIYRRAEGAVDAVTPPASDVGT